MSGRASLKRQQQDVRKLIAAGYDVDLDEASASKGSLEFMVNNFKGPVGSELHMHKMTSQAA